MHRSLTLLLAVALGACAGAPTLGESPEAQIQRGAQTVTATTTLATTLLRNQKITVPQAKSFRTMLVAAGDSLKEADAELVACRAATHSTPSTSPDPCWPKVGDVVTIALTNIAGVKRALDSRN